MLQASLRRSVTASVLPSSSSLLTRSSSANLASALSIADRPRQQPPTLITTTSKQVGPFKKYGSAQYYYYGCRRWFHATAKKEILPLIAVAGVLVIGRYSWRALQRMDVEWEDYQWELQQYEKQLAREGSVSGTVLAVDLGSLFMKVCTNQTVIVSREGDRAVFNGVWFDNRNDNSRDSEVSILRNRQALEKFFFARPTGDECMVQLPWNALNNNNNNNNNKDAAKDIVSSCVSPVIKETLDRINNEQLVRMVVTAPPDSLDVYSKAFENVVRAYNSELPAVILPEPVATIWGAQTKNVLPDDHDSNTVAPQTTLVVDVGAFVSQISAVQRDIVLASVAIPWGGENFVRSAVDLLLKESPVPLQDARSLSALQLQARASVMELSSKTRVSVYVPYLFPDPGSHHLDTTLSRSVLEQAVKDDIRHSLFDNQKTNNKEIFSPHLPPPADLPSMWMSSITQVLEQGRLLPSNVDHVLIVGGASKPPCVVQSLQTALFLLMGSEATSKQVVPDPSLQSELTVIGASTMLPSFEYSPDLGLQRIKG